MATQAVNADRWTELIKARPWWASAAVCGLHTSALTLYAASFPGLCFNIADSAYTSRCHCGRRAAVTFTWTDHAQSA